MPAERVVLVTVQLDPRYSRGWALWLIDDEAAELRELAAGAGSAVVGAVTARRHQPVAGTFLGTGKLQDIARMSEELQAQAVLFNQELSPAQQRNIEELLRLKTIDRTQLILDIFAQRATSQEGKLQVELAQLRYLLPRLVGKGVMLSRLGGGIGTRGPGEQKLEVDRRRIRSRIARLTNELAQLGRRRAAIRARRKETEVPVVALVGYTNAGKTTLLNCLTGASAVARDQPFTTLDPLARRLRLPSGESVVLTDTVGFLHYLPHHLIEAFKATLEETRHADVLLHVLDASHERALEQAQAVEQVLEQLDLPGQPTITALNKRDRVDDAVRLTALERAYAPAAAISAKTGDGVERLLCLLDDQLALLLVKPIHLRFPAQEAEKAAAVYRAGQVLRRRDVNGAVELTARLPAKLRTALAPYEIPP
jgi:GTP-binding protein HflX